MLSVSWPIWSCWNPCLPQEQLLFGLWWLWPCGWGHVLDACVPTKDVAMCPCASCVDGHGVLSVKTQTRGEELTHDLYNGTSNQLLRKETSQLHCCGHQEILRLQNITVWFPPEKYRVWTHSQFSALTLKHKLKLYSQIHKFSSDDYRLLNDLLCVLHAHVYDQPNRKTCVSVCTLLNVTTWKDSWKLYTSCILSRALQNGRDLRVLP